MIGRRFFVFLSHHFQILIHRRSTQPTHPCQFADIHLLCRIRRVMLIEHRRDIVLRGWPPSQLSAIRLGVLHAAAHTGADHLQFQFREDACHLQEGGGHGVELSGAAVDSDAADDDQTQVFIADDIYDIAQLFCAAAQA